MDGVSSGGASGAAFPEALGPIVPTMLDSVDGALVVVGSDHRILYCNRRMLGWLERTLDEAVGQRCYALMRRRSEPCPDCPSTIAARTGEIVHASRPGVDGTGCTQHVEISAYPANATGSVPLVIEYGRDISERVALEAELTERKRTEAALTESRNMLRAVIEGTSDFVFVKDAAMRHIYMNETGARALGMTVEEMLGRTAEELFGPEQGQRLNEIDRRVVETGQTISFDEDFDARGIRQTFLTTKAPYRDAEGNVIGLVGIARDITDRKRRETGVQFLSRASEVLATTLDYQATLSEIAKLAVEWLADWCVVGLCESGDLQCVGAAHHDPAKGEVVRELMLRPWPGLGAGHPVVRAMRTGRAAMATNDSSVGAVLADSRASEIVAVLHARSYMAVPLVAGRRVLGSLGLVISESARSYDAIDLALAEELGRRAGMAIENARLYAIARHAIQAREDLLATVSHDLRNPLNALMVTADLVEQSTSSDDSRTRSHVLKMKTLAERMTHLIRDLLDAAALEAGGFPLDKTIEDAGEILDAALRLMMPIAEQRGVRLARAPAAELPDLPCDREAILRVFSNLIGNAIQFTPAGGTITVSGAENDGTVEYSVRDSGAGIADEAFPHLFDRYWQAKRANRSGAGLGLFIVKGIVEAHGGRAWAESQLGAGSTFHFSLPRRV